MTINNPKLTLTFLGEDVSASTLEVTGDDIEKGSITSTFQLFSSLKSSSRQYKLTLKRKSKAVESIIRTEGDIKAVLSDASGTLFSGYLSTNYSWTLSDSGEQDLSITIEDNGSKLLGKPFVRSGKHLFKCTAYNAVKAICDKCGIELSSSAPIISTEIVKVVSEGDTCKDILSTLLYETGYVYFFENDGKMNLFSFLTLPKTESTHLDGSSLVVNGSKAITLSKKVRQYKSAKVKFTELGKAEDYLVYRNTTGQDASHKYCNLSLKPNEAFDGAEIYTIDPTVTRTATLIEAVNAESETELVGSRDIIAIENVSAQIEKNSNISASITGVGGPYLQIEAENKSSNTYAITRLDAYADIVYEKAQGVVISGEDTDSSDNTLEEELTYIHDKDNAEKHANLLTSYYKYSGATYTFYSREDIGCGSVVKINDDVFTGLNVLVLIYAKTETDSTGMVEYKAVGYSEFNLDKTTIIQRQLFSPVRDMGAKGEKGDTGATGAQGIQGIQGEKGEKGDKGDTGATGSTGVGISTIVEYYAVSSSNSTAPTSWSTSVPTLTATNKYLWNYEVITYTDSSKKETAKRIIGVYGDKGETGATGAKGDTGSQGPKGDTGATGNGISTITNYYLASIASTGVTTSTSGWTTTVQSLTSIKKYLWNYEKITYTNFLSVTSTPCVIGVYGDKGDTGAKGDKGDTGATGAQGPQGEKGDTGAKGDKGETGATGAKGDKGDTGAKGDKGDTGATGSSITTSVQYLLSTSSSLTESQQASLTTWVDGTVLSWSYGYYIYKRLKKENVDNGSVTYTYLGRDTAQENYYKSLLSFSITADRSTYFKNLRAQASETTTIQIKVNDRYYSPSSINWTLNGTSFSPTYSSGLYSFTVPLKNPKDSYTVKATPVKNSSAITGASSSIVLTVVDITENYKFFGSVTSLSSVGSGQVLLDGDSCFLTTANAIYVYQNGSWVEFNSCTLSDDIKTLILSKAQKAAFEYAENNELSQDYGYFKTLVAKYIYARNIGVEDLKLDEGGVIRSGGYLVDGTNPTGNSGIYINADGKVLMEDAQVNGSFSNTKINANESQTILWSKALPFLYLDGDYNSRDELYSPSELVKKAYSSLVDGSTEKFIYTKAMYFSANGSYAPIFVYNASSSNISEISAGIYFKHGYASGMIYNGSSYEGYLIVVSDSAITESALKSTSYFASASFSFETSLLLGCMGGCPRILVPSSKAEHRTIGDIFDPTLVHNLAEGTATWVPCILVEDVVYECTENFVITVLNNSTISQSSPYKEPVKTTQTLGKYIKLSKLAGSSSSNLYYHFSTDKNTWTVLGDSVFFTDLTVAANTDSATITGKFNFFQATSLEVRDLNKANSSFDETCKISVYSLYSSRIYTQDLRASWSIATEHLQANDVAAGEVCAQDLKADVARHNSILPLVNVDSNVGSTIAPFKKIYADELIGKLSGNVNGNVTGNTSGTHTGNVTGNVNSRGDTTHEVWCAVFN